jgi:Protein of unknown function (DUF2933)
MQMLKMCLNWKVLAALAAVGVGIYLVAPDMVLAALPILLLAACPLSMLLMMWSMQHTQGHQTPHEPDVGLTREEQVAQLRTQQAALADQIAALEQEKAHPAENGRRQ